MKFCPNCGTKLIEEAKFCQECGFKIDSSKIETAEHSEQDILSNNVPTVDELNEKYQKELLYAKAPRVCAVDGQKSGLFSSGIKLSDGYYVCEKHWDKVFIGLPKKGDKLPSLVEFLYKLDDPNYVKQRSPEEQARIDMAKQSDAQRQTRSIEATSNINDSISHTKTNKTTTTSRNYHSGIHCPRCGSTNVQLINTDANVKKVKKSTSINLNPLHPLTMVNHHEKVVKKHSAGKIAAGVMTGGASLLITGTHDSKNREFHCQECGNVWRQK